jgi:hypothetical protein
MVRHPVPLRDPAHVHSRRSDHRELMVDLLRPYGELGMTTTLEKPSVSQSVHGSVILLES